VVTGDTMLTDGFGLLTLTVTPGQPEDEVP
jgi:hypothetical protein